MSIKLFLDENLPSGTSRIRNGKLFYSAQTIGQLKKMVKAVASTTVHRIDRFDVAIVPHNRATAMYALSDNQKPPKRAWAIFVGTPDE